MGENIFETIKKKDNNGKEYWSSRDLAKSLEYVDYRKFLNVIEKAKTACKNSGEIIENHFVHIDEMVQIGSGAERSIDTIYLSRYACYLIVQNSDPTKIVVAKGQTYFAIQTRRQEKMTDLVEDHNRVFLRGEMTRRNINLMGTASQAGVESFAIFQNAGYKGLTTQTDAKIKRENIKGQNNANLAHYTVGQKVRNTIRSLGGNMPENLSTADAIGKAKTRIKKSKNKRLSNKT